MCYKVVEEKKNNKKSCVYNSAPLVMLKSPGSCSVAANAAAPFLCTCEGFSPSIQRNMKISRQHDSHGSTLTATAVSSVTVCSIYSSVHWKNDLFTARKWTDLKYFSPATPEVGKQPHFCKRLVDKLFLIKTSLVDLMQLCSKMYSPEAPKSTEKNYKEKIKQIEKKNQDR